MKPLIEVCVRRHCCYDKEIPWHWDDGTNGLLTTLSGMGHTLVGRGEGLSLWDNPSSCRQKNLAPSHAQSGEHFRLIPPELQQIGEL
jgi:hypothetical protein